MMPTLSSFMAQKIVIIVPSVTTKVASQQFSIFIFERHAGKMGSFLTWENLCPFCSCLTCLTEIPQGIITEHHICITNNILFMSLSVHGHWHIPSNSVATLLPAKKLCLIISLSLHYLQLMLIIGPCQVNLYIYIYIYIRFISCM